MVPTYEQGEGRFAHVPVLDALTSGRTYRNLALLFLLFPIGIANFVVIVTGISVGLALTPFLIGIPLLAGVLVAVTWLAVAYAELLSGLTGHEVHCEGFAFGPEGFWAGLKDVATRRRPYVLLVAFFLSFPLGVASFTVLVTLFALSVALLLAPVLAPLPVTSYQFGPEWILDTPLELAASSLVGAVLLVVVLWLVRVIGDGVAGATAAMFEMDGGGRRPGTGTGEDRQRADTQDR